MFLGTALLTGAFVQARGDKKDTAASKAKEAFDALNADLDKEGKEAETKEEIDKLRKKYAPKMVAHAKAFPGDDTSCAALAMVVQMTLPTEEGALRDEAIKGLRKDFLKKPVIKNHVEDLTGNPFASDALALVRDVLKDNPDKAARGHACKALMLSNEQTVDLIRRMKGNKKTREAIESRFGAPSVKKLIDSEGELEPEIKVLRDRLVGEFKGVVPYIGIGAEAPGLEATDLEGKKMKLSDLKGKVVVVDFWATWCPPCREMIPLTRKLVKKMDDKLFVFVSVSVDKNEQTVKEFKEKTPMPWTHWWIGPRSKALSDWDIKGYPTVYLLDEKGVIRFSQVGYDEDDKLGKEAEKLVKVLEESKKK